MNSQITATQITASQIAASQTPPSRTPARPLPSRSRRLLSALLATLAALVTAVAMSSPAGAYTISTRSNVPVLPTVYVVQGAHNNIGSAVTGPMWKPYVFQSGPVAYRASTSGAQTVRVTYTVERWNGSAWVYETGQTSSGTISSSLTSVKLPSLSQYVGGGYYYRVRFSLTWTSAIGAVLASMSGTMNASGEYVCSTAQTCTTASNSIYLR